jgi:phosphatidylethanolamine/phosphatidyl-N-methylethanolamine N-methyltransferase
VWNRIRYTFWAPWYDGLVAAADFGQARQRSIQGLGLQPGARVLLVGAGTGLDLEYLPRDVTITAVDITPAMLERCRRRAERLGIAVDAQVMDARQLTFKDEAFDVVVFHLVLAVMPEPERGLREAERVLKPGGRVAVFDKFLGDGEHASLIRRLANLVIRPLFSDLNRRLGPLVHSTALEITRDEPIAFGGLFRVVTLSRPPGSAPMPSGDA